MYHPKGFTLIELVVVLLVIAVLVGVSIPVMGSVLENARVSRARADVDNLAKAILKVYEHTTYWPANNVAGSKDIHSTADWNQTRNGLTGTSTDAAVLALYPGYKGPYILKVTDDPWGRPYHFDGPGRLGNQDSTNAGQISVMSYGPDGANNGSVNNANRQQQGDDIAYYFR